jgi:hypothetical protein
LAPGAGRAFTGRAAEKNISFGPGGESDMMLLLVDINFLGNREHE